MNLGQIRDEIKVRTSDNSLSSTNIDRWVNVGIKEWASRADWPSLITTYEADVTVASQAEYTLQTDFKRMVGVRVGAAASSTETDAVDYSFVEYNSKNVLSTGNFYYLNPTNDKYGLIPTPSTAGLPIFYKYIQIPADLTDNALDTPPFPENYHELVVFFALKKYWEAFDDFEKVLFYDAEFENTIERMKNELLNRSQGSLQRMRDVREFVGIEHPKKLNSVELGQ